MDGIVLNYSFIPLSHIGRKMSTMPEFKSSDFPALLKLRRYALSDQRLKTERSMKAPLSLLKHAPMMA